MNYLSVNVYAVEQIECPLVVVPFNHGNAPFVITILRREVTEERRMQAREGVDAYPCHSADGNVRAECGTFFQLPFFHPVVRHLSATIPFTPQSRKEKSAPAEANDRALFSLKDRAYTLSPVASVGTLSCPQQSILTSAYVEQRHTHNHYVGYSLAMQ